MKYFAIFSLLLAMCLPLAAEPIYLKDVPDGHYAYDPVYDLIKMGVTGGYPDGTFRGKKPMTRYEIAAFISKFDQYYKTRSAADEKLVAELRSETARLADQQQKTQAETKLTGELFSRWRLARNPNQNSSRADYRVKFNVLRELGDGASLALDLDTMDSGYGGVTRELLKGLLDFEGRAKFGRLDLKVTDGPGDVVHSTDADFPADVNLTYRRLKRTISAGATLGRTTLSLGYLCRSAYTSGTIEVGETSFLLSQDLAPLKVTLNPRLFAGAAGKKDLRIECSAKLFALEVLVGAAKSADYPHGLYCRGQLDLGEGNRVSAQKIGSQYRENFTYGIFDIFDRKLADGTTNYGLDYKVALGQPWFFRLLGDLTEPGSITTLEYQLGYNLNQQTSLDLLYQTYQNSQVIGVAANLKI